MNLKKIKWDFRRIFTFDTISKAFITLLTSDERVADSMPNFVKLLPHVVFASEVH